MYEALNDIHKEIKKALNDVPDKCRTDGNRSWTKEVKNAIAGVTSNDNDPNSCIYANNCDHAKDGEHEWLYDLVWAIDENEWNLKRLMLVMECEWSIGRDDQRYDFQKLLIAKSAIKLFVFQASSEKILEETINDFRKMICAYEDKNNKESYLFAGLLYAEQGKEHFKYFNFNQDGNTL